MADVVSDAAAFVSHFAQTVVAFSRGRTRPAVSRAWKTPPVNYRSGWVGGGRSSRPAAALLRRDRLAFVAREDVPRVGKKLVYPGRIDDAKSASRQPVKFASVGRQLAHTARRYRWR